MHVTAAQRDHRSFGGVYPLAPLALLWAVACGGSSGTTQPSPTPSAPVNLSGSWGGSASDSSGPGQMSWQLAQTDTAFSGGIRMTDTGTGVGGTGSVSGSVSGAAVQFSITVPAGGFQSPYGSCTATASGSGQATSSTITGTYTGSNSCSGTISSGQLSLNKQ
jgi:hypothetical protein